MDFQQTLAAAFQLFKRYSIKLGRIAVKLLWKLCGVMPIAQAKIDIAQAFQKGQEQGLAAGQQAGETTGFKKGYDEGKTILAIDWQDPKPQTSQVDDALVPSASLGLTEQIVQKIKDDIARKLKPTEQPTPDQWKMILSDVRCTYVVAGAGSGKSTSLVLRLIVLHVYLGIPLSELSVFTFTKASRLDFASKMRKVFAKWRIQLDEPASMAIVRTFHSVILKFMRSVHPRIQAFENLGRQSKQTQQQFEDAAIAFMEDANNADDTPENPFDPKLESVQLDLLKDTYQQTYEADAGFRQSIQVLLERSLEKQRLDPREPKIAAYLRMIAKIAERDIRGCDAVRAQWMAKKHWPIKGVRDVRKAIQINDQVLYADGVVEATDLPVFLGWDEQFGKSPDIKDTTFDVQRSLLIKHRVIRAKFHGRAYFLETVRQAKDLENLLTFTTDGLQNNIAPMFDFALGGSGKPRPIHEVFWSEGGFIESMNMNVMDAIGQSRLLKDSSEAWFCKALSIYWFALCEQFRKRDILTFNQMFMLFSERSPANLERVGDSVLKSLQHLMVDEFQDISPQIVSWIRASAMELRRRGLSNSLLCVGDDWQSIYGWRGSSPHYLIDFERHFKASHHLCVSLRENYRSSQAVIDAAETMLKGVAYKVNKHGLSTGGAALAGDCPECVDMKHTREIIPRIEAIVQNESDSPVLVLSRRRAELKAIEQGLSYPLRKKVNFKTFHTSKGLEAHSVILVGNCAYEGTAPIRNELYRLAGMAQTYDAAQRDEALRLAYVAVTRAKRWCYWFADKNEGAFGIAKANTQLFKQGTLTKNEQPAQRSF